MEEFQVTFKIDEKQKERLQELLEIVRNYESSLEKGKYPFKDLTLAELFQNLMRLGSYHKINDSIDGYYYHFERKDNN